MTTKRAKVTITLMPGLDDEVRDVAEAAGKSLTWVTNRILFLWFSRATQDARDQEKGGAA